MAEKSGFKTVDSNLEEIDAKIREHRFGIYRRMAIIGITVIALCVGTQLWMEMRSYSSYSVLSSVDRNGSSAARYETFLGNIIEYSNDGINYVDGQNEQIWNQSFEMTSPVIEMCEDYLTVYDQSGTEIYIMTEAGLQEKIETSKPIQKVCIAEQGTIAVLMKENDVSYVKLYDKKGKELANGEFYGSKGGCPIDIALSHDAKKMAVDIIDVNGGSVKSTITFYNFGSVGQNEIDNNVGSFSFDNVFIPDIAYMADNCMVAMGDEKFIIFGGKEKPKVIKEIPIEQELKSVFYNENYIGVTYESEKEGSTYHIKVYDIKGKIVMENDTELFYDTIRFLSNNEICVRNEEQCELFTKHSVKKFSYTFDNRFLYAESLDRYQNYLLIFQGTTEEVRLK